MIRTLAVVSVAGLLAGCASSWEPSSPPVPPLSTRVLLEDPKLADISDIQVDTGDDGTARRVIVAGGGGAVFLDENLRVTQTHCGRTPGGGMLIDLDGDDVPERLYAGNSVFMAPIVARRLTGELLFQFVVPLEPSDFAGHWVRAMDRDGDGIKEIFTSVKGADRAIALDMHGKHIGTIPIARIDTDERVCSGDVDGDGRAQLIYGSEGSVIAVDGFGVERMRVKLHWIHFVSGLFARTRDDGSLELTAFGWRDKHRAWQHFRIGTGPQLGALTDITNEEQSAPRCSFQGIGPGYIQMGGDWGYAEVSVFRLNGEEVASSRFDSPGVGRCGQALHPGVVRVIRLPGQEHHQILVGVGQTLWLAELDPGAPVPAEQ